MDNTRRAHVLRAMTHVPEAAVFGLVATNEHAAAFLAQLEAQVNIPMPSKELTREIVEWAMLRHDGNVSAAARFLCVPRTTLRCALARLEPAQ